MIASVYSPDLETAQEELLEAQKIKETQPELFKAAREKLKNWKLTEGQIDQVLQSKNTMKTFNIQAECFGLRYQKNG